MKRNYLLHSACLMMLLLANRANSQTFSKGFELLTGTQQSTVYNVYDTYGPNNIAPNLRPFSVWGTGLAYGQGAYLIGDGQFNAHSGSNLFSFSAAAGNNCLGLLASCPLEDNKTYKISFWAASWTVLQRNAELASPILAIKRPNATWLVGTAEISPTDVDTFYPNASSGSYATWANDTGNYYSVGTNWTSTTASYNGILTWKKYEHTFTNVGSNTTISICNTVQQSSAILTLDDISCEEVIVPCTPIVGLNSSPMANNLATGTSTTLNSSASSGLSGTTSFSWSGTSGFSSTQQNPSTGTLNTAGGYSYTVTATNASGTGTCTATASTTLTVSSTCTLPSFLAETSKVTCAGSTPNTDGKLLITGVNNGDRVAYSLGATYNGVADYSTSTLITSLSPAGQVTGNLTNPTSSQQYTIRVYNGSNTCYTDQPTTLLSETCIVPCGTPQCRSVGVRVN